MSLSKNNIVKLKNFIKQNNFVNNNNSDNNLQESKNFSKIDEPSKIFYSIIDNSDNIKETSKENLLLKKSEDSLDNMNPIKNYYSNNLSTEDELYDEFNYLLEE